MKWSYTLFCINLLATYSIHWISWAVQHFSPATNLNSEEFFPWLVEFYQGGRSLILVSPVYTQDCLLWILSSDCWYSNWPPALDSTVCYHGLPFNVLFLFPNVATHLLHLQQPYSPVPGISRAPGAVGVQPTPGLGPRQVGNSGFPKWRGAEPPRDSQTVLGSLKVGRGGHTPGMDPPSPPTFAPRPRHPRSPCAEKKHGRSLRALEQKAGDLDPGAYRHENNDRTGSAWGWASGSPSRQTSLSRNLGGTVFSLGVQFRYRSGMEEQA